MAIREILTVPDPRLKLVSKPVDAVDDALRALMDDMVETMYAADGIGLAAIQVGEPLRVIVMDLAGEGEEPQPRYFVNPVILDPSDDTKPYEEGCLSIPGITEDIKRPKVIKVVYQGINGVMQRNTYDDLWSTCFQHELDHLNGKLFIDHLRPMKKILVKNKMKKTSKKEKKA